MLLRAEAALRSTADTADTAMMTEYIRAEMPNKSDLLELVVAKAENFLEKGDKEAGKVV